MIKYTTDVAASIQGVEAVGYDASVQRTVLSDCSKHLKAMNDALVKLETTLPRLLPWNISKKEPLPTEILYAQQWMSSAVLQML